MTPLLESDTADPRHGTENGYRHCGCHCVRCSQANADAAAKYRLQRRLSPIPPHVHGTVNGYTNYRCHCDACTDAHTSANARRKATHVRHWPLVRGGQRVPACGVFARPENLSYAFPLADLSAVTCRRCLRARAHR